MEDEKCARPPLTGTPEVVPDGLFDVPWDKLEDAYGSAVDTPYYILGLTSDDSGDREYAQYWLSAATTHQGSVYPASKAVIPFLLDVIGAEEHNKLVCGSYFLTRIALGETHWIHSPRTVFRSEYFSEIALHTERIESLYRRTRTPDLLRLLCFCPGGLRAPLVFEGTPVEMANKLIAQGFLAAERKQSGQAGAVRGFLSNDWPTIVRGAAAVSLAFSGDADDEVLTMLTTLTLNWDDSEHTRWVWSYEFEDLLKSAWLYSAEDNMIVDCDVDDRAKADELLRRHFGSVSNRPLHPNELSPGQRIALGCCVKGNYTYHLNEFGLPTTQEAVLRLLRNREDALTQLISLPEYGGSPMPVWHVLTSYLFGLGDEPELCVALAALENPWEACAELTNKRKQFTLQLPRLKNRDEMGFNTHVGRIISCFANIVTASLSDIETYLDGWLTKVPKLNENENWGFETDSIRMAIGLLALARHQHFPPRFEALVRPYHNASQYSHVPLVVIAELLRFTSEKHQRFVVDEAMLFQFSEPEPVNDSGEETLSGSVVFSKADWTLLSGCRGPWVREGILRGLEELRIFRSRWPSARVCAFPYALAAQCLQGQESVDETLLLSLPKF